MSSASKAIDFFETNIRPVLVARCYSCHSAQVDEPKAGLRLDTMDGWQRGGDSGPAVVPGDIAKSLIIDAIRYDSYEMPPDGQLSDAVVGDFVRWVEMGAPAPVPAEPVKPQEHARPLDVHQHWAFVPPRRPAVPEVADTNWPKTEIDRFILARLNAAGVEPSPAADRRTLLRRLAYSLVGLPPSFQDVKAFENDPSPESYKKQVDRLLAMPQYGERWARHWLDVARYSDSKGYVFMEDRNYPQAYTYRDWVIRAFDDDMPYDRFLMCQIAADQVAATDDPTDLAAMGFLTLGRRFINNQHDIIDDRIDVLMRGTMGLTVSCARCHDHKYDPIPTADYYSLYGVFASSEEPGGEPSPLRLVDRKQPITPRIFLRGNPARPGPEVPRQFLAVLSGPNRKPFEQGSGRRELAEEITSPTNPLTARVWVNRVWSHLFGAGLVTTPSDFGTRSDPPSHPVLLDYLATRFVAEGWSTKKLIREIVLSRVYQQASQDRPEARAVDPENRLFWQSNRQRLDFESLRDSLLVVAGQVDLTQLGPSVDITQKPFSRRRTVYAFIERQNLPGVFRTFDFASPDTHSPWRYETTVPQQALFMMNAPFVLEQAQHLADRRAIQEAPDRVERVRHVYRAAFGRDPTTDELELGVAFIASQTHSPLWEKPTWQYGYGEFDESTGYVVSFRPMPHFTGTAWQGGAMLPDEKMGWVMLHANGGHPGDSSGFNAIRRWVAPRDGVLAIRGILKHPSDQGDGVRGRIVSSHSGLVDQWTAQNGETGTVVESLEVSAGDTIDFVADCRASTSFDGFTWTVRLRLEPARGDLPASWDSTADFRGPRPERLGRWAQYAQVLLMSNEFAFFD